MDNKIQVRRFDFFLIKGYQNDASSNSFIDNYVRSNSAGRKRYFEYHMFFLKESATTSLKSLEESLKPKAQALANEDDFIFYYNWRNYGKDFEKEKSDSGKTLPPKNIKIENVPIPDDTVKK
ncbi:MAG: hypothetical protein M3O71_04720 [Bacteroidota bacterium]|nr:hypothetical protein [Bacteroidota bacterium]